MAQGQSRALWLLVRSALTGALGGLLFGFDTAVIAGTTHALQLHYALSEAQKGFTVAIALYGTVAGAMLAGPIGQRIGSRTALRWMGLLYVISAAGCALAGPWWSLLAFRALGGLGIGGSSVLGPVYIAELAPAKWRGRLVGLFQINIVIGILLAYLSNAIVAHLVPALDMQWRWQFGVGILPAVLFLILLLSVPQSSRWLVSQSRFDEAQRILFQMGSPDSEAEVDAIRKSLEAESGAAHDHLFVGRYKLLIFLAISIGFFNQLSGINAILYYLNDIFRSAGFSSVSADMQAVAIGAANLVATLIGISLIDKLGRKTLLLIGAVGDALCLIGVALVYTSNSHQNLSATAAHRLHLVLRHLAGRGHLGLSQRGLPHQRPLQGPGPRLQLALDHERRHRQRLPDHRGLQPGGALLVLRGHDGGGVLRRPDDLPRDQGADPGGNEPAPGAALVPQGCRRTPAHGKLPCTHFRRVAQLVRALP